MGSRRKPADELVQLVGAQLRGPVVDQVRLKVTAWNDPRARLDRRRRRAGRVMTFWLLVLALLSVVGVFSLLGVFGTYEGVASVMGIAVAGVLAVRTGTKIRELNSARQRLELTAPPARPPLPAKGSAARRPMERLVEAEDTLRELLRQLDSASVTSVPTDSVEQARATSAEAAAALRSVSAQLQAVERARDTAPPLDRAPLVEGVRRLRGQLDDGVEGYCALVAAAGRTLAASTASSNPKQVLNEATDHLAGLASALRDLAA
jgi:HAMP domain-containing protein